MIFVRLLLLILVLSVSSTSVSVLCISAASAQDTALEGIPEAEQQFNMAFTAILEAEAAGAEETQIAAVIDKLDSAANLIEQAKLSQAQGNSTGMSESAAGAAYIAGQVIDEANQLRDAARTSSLYTKVLVFSMVPVAAVIVTVCIHYVLKWRRRNEVERIMRMEIKEK
jgi:hypothetical protein